MENQNENQNSESNDSFIGKRFTRKQLVLAFVVAAIADVVLFPVAEAGVLALFLDAITAGLLFIILGWRWILLPALVTECIPAVNIFPFWILVVGSLAVFGTVKRPGENEVKQFLESKNTINSQESKTCTEEPKGKQKSKVRDSSNFVDASVIDENDK